jgi:hypothetical protein
MTQTFVEKLPVVSIGGSLGDAELPVFGYVDCERQSAWTDESGRHLARISTDRPWGVESTTGETQFVVFASQLTD